MNKKFFNITTIAIVAIATVSCSDEFFETSSKTTMNSETAYSNLTTAQMALIGCYDGWQRTISDEGVGIYMMAEIASDECFAGEGVGDDKNYCIIDEFSMEPASSYVSLFETDWSNYYNAINRCNTLIKSESNIDWGGDETAHQRIMGECRGIRGILYFDLVRMFGDVPLLTEPSGENIPRSAAKDVFTVIFEDLKYAAANVPADAYNGTNLDNTDGHMSKYAAEALLARAYLFYTGYYGAEHPSCTKAEAIAAIDDVVDNGGYALEANYADLWMPACTEDATVDGTYAWKTTYAGKYYNDGSWHAGQTGLSKEFVLNLKMNSTSDYSGNGDGLVFQVFLGTRNVSKAPIATGWGICNPNPQFLNTYMNGDPRLDASVVDHAARGFESQGNFNQCISDSYEYTGYSIKKYAPLCFSDGTREAEGFQLGIQHMNLTYYIDYTIVRYADVLLMHSELHEDATGLNAVQARAGVATTGYSLEAIRNERAREFAFEGIRYWDILRYGEGGSYAADVLYKNQNGVAIKNGGIDASFVFDASNFTSKSGLMQIPNSQITLSGNVLTQNAGW